MLQDLRRSIKSLTRSPGFVIGAVLSLAFGIGANAAIFSVVDVLLLQSLPVSDPQSLVLVSEDSAERTTPTFSYPYYTRLKESGVLDGLASHSQLGLNAEINGHPARISAELVAGNYFDLLGTGAQLGRPLTAADDRVPGGHPVIVISDRFWRHEFRADGAVLGRPILMNNHTFTIIGIAARGFTGTNLAQPTDVWLPMAMQAAVGRDLFADWRTNWLGMIGRLPRRTTRERAAAELNAYLQRHEEVFAARGSDARARRIALFPGDKGSSSARHELVIALRLLIAMTVLALLAACLNVANLLLARAAARERDIAVRLALGARRITLARQVLIETLLLAVAGGVMGMVAAPWAAGVFVRSRQLPVEPTLDMRVFLFGLGASVITGLVVGVAPIVASRRIGLAQIWGTESRASVIVGRLSLRDLVVVSQIAVALALVVGAGLLGKSFNSLSSVDPGFRADNLLLVSLDPASAGYGVDRIDGFWRETLERSRQVLGVQTASLARIVPLSEGRQRQKVFDETTGGFQEIDTNFVGPDYFQTMGIPLRQGREFDIFDRRVSRPVVIVSDTLARAFWPGQDPIGKQLRIKTGEASTHEVVGVVSDVKYRELRGDPGPMLYRPILQTRSTDAMTLHLRAAGDPEALIGTIRRELHMLDANVPLFQITTLEAQLNQAFAQTRQAAVLTSGFGTLALLLSALGIYGVTALTVTRQTRNIGIRMALGAGGSDIMRLVIGRGLLIVAAGLVVGLAGAYGSIQIAGALLFGVTAGDATTFAAASLVLAAICLIAIYIPARTAVNLDPVAALRHD